MDQSTTRPWRDPALPRPRVAELADRIEQDINVGMHGIGAWLKQVDLEARYGCTRIDLRQALDRLVERGLVRRVANRGYQVEELDPRRAREIREVRAVLEVAAAEDVAARIDAAGLAAMQTEAERFEAAVLGGTVIEQEAANNAFHERMLAHCDNREMVALIFDLRRRVPLAVTRRHNTTALLQRAARDHFEIVRLLRARDMTALAALMRRHVIADLAAPAEAGRQATEQKVGA
jgi:DNA-binding GntR family transcriptional regulator